MLPLVLLLLAQPVSDSRVTRVERVPGGRAEGGRSGVKAWAFFEAFPASGAGTFGACSTTPPTGAKGETLSFARTGAATCTRTATGGLATTGIADGDLSEMSGNQARVEYDSSGVLGLLVEALGVNVLPRFIEFANATWADVGTPTLTGSQTSPFTGTYATSAVLFSDNDGAAFEGRSQPITVTAGAAYFGYCFVKAGTATSARIVLDGTAATITGLSSSTWSIVEVADVSASAASVTLEVDVGSTTATTGTVTFGGCDVKAGTRRTSIVPTAAAAVTRNEDFAYRDVTLSGPVLTLGVTATGEYATPDTSRLLVRADSYGATAFSTNLYATATGAYAATEATGSIEQTTVATGSWSSAKSLCNSRDGTTAPTYYVASAPNSYTRVEGIGPVHTRIYIGNYSSAGILTPANAILSRIYADPASGKCRP